MHMESELHTIPSASVAWWVSSVCFAWCAIHPTPVLSSSLLPRVNEQKRGNGAIMTGQSTASDQREGCELVSSTFVGLHGFDKSGRVAGHA